MKHTYTHTAQHTLVVICGTTVTNNAGTSTAQLTSLGINELSRTVCRWLNTLLPSSNESDTHDFISVTQKR